MSNSFFDYEEGEFCYCISDSMATDFEGHMLMRMSDSMAMDIDSGNLHIISNWDTEDEHKVCINEESLK